MKNILIGLILLIASCTYPEAQIGSSSYDVVFGDSFTLTNLTSDSKRCLWAFPDGTTSDQNQVTITAKEPGDYVVRLTVWSGNKSDYTGKTIHIHQKNEGFRGGWYCSGPCELTCSESHHMMLTPMNGDSIYIEAFRSPQGQPQSFSRIWGRVSHDTLRINTSAYDDFGNHADIQATGIRSGNQLNFDYTINDTLYGGSVYGVVHCSQVCIKD